MLFFQLFAQRDKLEKHLEDAAIRETAMIHHMSDVESDPEEGVSSDLALEGRQLKYADTLM